MTVSSSDVGFGALREATAGVTPTAPTFLEMDFIPGSEPKFESDFLESPVLKKNRGSAGGRKHQFRVEDGIEMHLFRDAAVDLHLESSLSGKFATKVLKGGATDTSMTIEKTMPNGSGVGVLYRYFRGVQVKKMTITGSASDNVKAKFDYVGMSSTTANAKLPDSAYTPVAPTEKLDGLDVTMTIAGLAVDYTEFELTVEFDRSAQYKMGSAAARGVATGGSRKVSGNVKFFREDWSPEAIMLPDSGIPLVITIGSGVNGYKIEVPLAQFKIPQDSNDGASVMVTADYMGKDSPTAGTNIVITQL